jgi:hypothetical protein
LAAFPAASVGIGAKTGLAAVFFADFFAVFLAAGFFAAFFAVGFFAFLAFFATRFLAAALAARLPFFGFFEGFCFEDFFLAATTNSLNFCSNVSVGIGDPGNAYRVASESIENTEKTSGFRSRL